MFTPLSWHGRPCTPSKSPLSDHMALRCAHSEAMNASPASSTASTAVSRLLDAVEVLCAEMSPSDVTMRKIAAEAGLSVGLAYRYFESRDELFGAAMDRMAERIAAAAVGDDPITVVSALWKAVGDNPAFPRLVTSLILSGQNVSEVMSKHPLMREIAKSAAELGSIHSCVRSRSPRPSSAWTTPRPSLESPDWSPSLERCMDPFSTVPSDAIPVIRASMTQQPR